MTSPPVHANGDAGMTITAAAQVLGVSEKTIRRRIVRGELVAERVQRPHGFEYRVQLPVYPTDQGSSRGDRTASTPPASNGRHPSTHTDQAGILALVAEVRRLNDERAELYGRLGYMQAELAQAREQIRALQPAQEPIAAPPAGPVLSPLPAEPDPPRRPWWRIWG